MKFKTVASASVRYLDATPRITSAEVDEQLMPTMEGAHEHLWVSLRALTAFTPV